MIEKEKFSDDAIRRIRECFWLFSNTIPIQEKYRKNLEEVFGKNFSEEIPKVIDIIAKVCIEYPAEFNGYLEFIKESIKYIREQRNELPEIDDDMVKIKQIMDIQLGYWTSDKKEKKILKIAKND